MTYGDDLPLTADDCIGVEMRLEAPVLRVPVSPAQLLARFSVEIDDGTAVMVVDLPTEIEQFTNDVLRNPCLLYTSPSPRD